MKGLKWGFLVLNERPCLARAEVLGIGRACLVLGEPYLREEAELSCFWTLLVQEGKQSPVLGEIGH